MNRDRKRESKKCGKCLVNGDVADATKIQHYPATSTKVYGLVIKTKPIHALIRSF